MTDEQATVPQMPKWEQGYRETLIKGIIRILTDNPTEIHTVNLENAYAELQVSRDKDGNLLDNEMDYLEM